MTDPKQILGVALNASDEDIRAAYLRKVKEHPPEQAPEIFEQVRDAYNTLRDPRLRMRAMLESGDAPVPLASLITAHEAKRRHCGQALWLEVLKRR